jgi:Ice-binding-like
VNAALGTRALRGLLLSVPLLAASFFVGAPAADAASPTPVNLGTADPFVILAGTPNITDAGHASVITGNVGLSPGPGSAIGLNCSQVTGTIVAVDGSGPLCFANDPTTVNGAKSALTAAYTDVMNRTPVITANTELGGTTKTPGVYVSNDTTFQISAPTPLVLDGQGDPNARFIFEANFDGTGLTVGPGSVVSLINGAQACNVYWRVVTATINTTAVFKGNILASQQITVAAGASVQGRLLAESANVTLDHDTITRSVCATPVTPAAPPVLAPPLFTG